MVKQLFNYIEAHIRMCGVSVSMCVNRCAYPEEKLGVSWHVVIEARHSKITHIHKIPKQYHQQL